MRVLRGVRLGIGLQERVHSLFLSSLGFFGSIPRVQSLLSIDEVLSEGLVSLHLDSYLLVLAYIARRLG